MVKGTFIWRTRKLSPYLQNMGLKGKLYNFNTTPICKIKNMVLIGKGIFRRASR